MKFMFSKVVSLKRLILRQKNILVSHLNLQAQLMTLACISSEELSCGRSSENRFMHVPELNID